MGARRAGADFTASNNLVIRRADGTEIEIGNPNHDDSMVRESARRRIAEANAEARRLGATQEDDS